MERRSLLLLALVLLASGGCAMHHDREFDDKPIVTLDAITISFGFGGTYHWTVGLDDDERAEFVSCFEPPPVAEYDERQCIRRAVALMERYVGVLLPTRFDLAVNQLPAGEMPRAGQCDCIDESTDTTSYLLAFERCGWLRHHEVLHPVYRASLLINPHNSAQIRELATGACWVVDSWYRDNGEPPDIARVEDWFGREPFSEDQNSELVIGPVGDPLDRGAR